MANWKLTTNQEVREVMKDKKVPIWKIAQKYGVSEMTLVRKLRIEMDDADKEKMIKAINEIAGSEQSA